MVLICETWWVAKDKRKQTINNEYAMMKNVNDSQRNFECIAMTIHAKLRYTATASPKVRKRQLITTQIEILPVTILYRSSVVGNKAKN